MPTKLTTLKPSVQMLDTSLATTLRASPQGAYGQGRGGRPWRRKVEAIKARDKYTCRMCSKVTIDGEVDHIVPLSQGGSDDESNLQYLCKEPCHAEKTKRELRGL